MSSLVAAAPAVGPLAAQRRPAEAPVVRRRVALAWALLVLNVLTFFPEIGIVVPVPGMVGRLLTQGALVGALLLALSVNRRVALRPSVFLALCSVLAAVAVMTSLRAEFVFGSVFRAGRFSLFLVVLWLLTPWWGRVDMLLVRTHLRVMLVVLGSVVAGALLAPGLGFADGRLTGALWPVPPTQVGHYAAVTTGLVLVLWLSGLLRRNAALGLAAVTVGMLLLSHTRTALVALLLGLIVAGLSLFVGRRRVRWAFGVGAAAVALGALTVSSAVTSWLARGQTAEDLANLTGRREVWDAVLAVPRTPFSTLFGFGLTNKSFDGLPIDSNWLATFHDLGLVGVVVNATAVLFLLVLAAFRPRSPARALALFLVVYATVASFTETGMSDASPYLLELVLAASLLAAPAARRGTT